jgi:hypothetical protein
MTWLLIQQATQPSSLPSPVRSSSKGIGRVERQSDALDVLYVLEQGQVDDAGHGFDVEEVGCGQFVEFVSDAFHPQIVQVAVQVEVDV